MINGIKERLRGGMTTLAKGAQKVGAATKEALALGGFTEQIGYQCLSLGMILREVPGAIRGNNQARRNLRIIDEVISENPWSLAKEAVLEMRRRMTNV